MNELIEEVSNFLNRGIVPKKGEISENYQELFEEIYQLNFLKSWIQDENIQEIIFHQDSIIELVKRKKNELVPIHLSRNLIDCAMELILLEAKVDWNLKNYFVSFKTIFLETPLRISMLHRSVGNQDHKYFIRKREKQIFQLSDFQLQLPFELKKQNIIIAGSTGSGKTSFLNALLQLMAKEKHTLILEDTRELQLSSPQVTYLHGAQRLQQFCADAMRLSPELLVLGEMRSQEILPFLLLLTSGHQGLLSTIHANSALDAIERMALLYTFYARQEIPFATLLDLLCRNIDLIIFMQDKKVNQVIEIKGHKNGHYLYENIGLNKLSQAV